MLRGKRNATALFWMMEVVGKNRYYVLLLALIQTILGASVIGYALFLRGLVDHAVAGDRTRFCRYGILLVALVVLLALLRWLKRYLEEYSKSSMENCFKNRLFHNLLHRDFGQVRALHSAEWMNRLTNDTKVVADGLTQVLPNLCEMVARLAAAVIALIVMQPKFSYIILPGGLILIVASLMFRTRLKDLHQVIQERDGFLRIFYQERLHSQIVIRVFNKEDQTEKEQKLYLDGHRNARM